MIPLSSRYASLLLGLIVIGMVPVIVHSYTDRRDESCANPDALRDVDQIPKSLASPPSKDSFPWLDQWSLGTISSGKQGIPPYEFQILRSFEPHYLYPNPGPSFMKEFVADRHEVEWIETDLGRLPVHWLVDHAHRTTRFVGYMFVYGQEPVASPLLAQLEQAASQVLAGSRPLTVFLISGWAYDGIGGSGQQRAIEWLRDAWSYYQKVCSS